MVAAQIVAALNSHKRSKVLDLLQRKALPATGHTIEDSLRYIENLRARGTETLSVEDSRSPPLLREIPDPPLALYIQGQLRCLGQRAVAIVGLRRASANGVLMARECAGALARRGIVVVSGLSEAVLVIEASLRSGSLITARMALEQGRDVFAVPGSVFADNSRGCHRLSREGAALVDCVETLLDELHVPSAEPPQSTPAEPKGSVVLGALSETTPQAAEELAGKLSCSVQEVLLALFDLEARGIVVLSDGGYIRLPPA